VAQNRRFARCDRPPSGSGDHVLVSVACSVERRYERSRHLTEVWLSGFQEWSEERNFMSRWRLTFECRKSLPLAVLEFNEPFSGCPSHWRPSLSTPQPVSLVQSQLLAYLIIYMTNAVEFIVIRRSIAL
jgi:hypothetical protein